MGGRREYGGWRRERGKRRGSLDLCSTDLQRGKGGDGGGGGVTEGEEGGSAGETEGKGAAVTVELQRGKRAADLQMGKVGGGGGGGGGGTEREEGGATGGTEGK
ncbi:glycine-rich protein DOT1-like [Salvia miltiorrhiza]|uniref:glycine-rich protein DOT1-like n=1 Tax=Salvia miltiorrhiza TaxID=226208 RepID=UPI0025AC070E|nr:glycine-rich protein DOT1-like [Salvia miltiorrhiza]